jgi:hypothetical protein
MTGSFLPHMLREYSLVADGEHGALIGPDGAFAWLCVPRWDSPAVLLECAARLSADPATGLSP